MQLTTPAIQTAKPFLKWAGGKQQLIDQLVPLFPPSWERYFEPFLGGAAVFFHLRSAGRLHDGVLLSDNNAELINTYVVVRDDVDALIDLLFWHEQRHSREHYYKTRAQDRGTEDLDNVQRAARMIYLNRTCFNGLYRVNSKGHFNVPMGSYRDPKIVFADTLRSASAALRHVQLNARGFESVVGRASAGDLVYFDPPYDPLTKTASFTSYTADSFRDDHQRQLASVYAELSAKGCYCMLSNSDTEFIRELYARFRIVTVKASRAINSNGSRRGQINEVVVVNY